MKEGGGSGGRGQQQDKGEAGATNDAQQRQLQLVYPGEADINAGKVSVLTPIGAALIGLRQGQTIPWSSRDGRDLILTVVEVRQEA